MCLILLAYHWHPDYPIVLAANRDEFYDRPERAAHFWPDEPTILAGRDLVSGGTWLGVDRNGRFAALSNYRDPKTHRSHAQSRGAIVADFLRGQIPAQRYLEALRQDSQPFNGFNVLAGDDREVLYYSNWSDAIQALSPGVHGLSNHLLDTPWPKVEKGKAGLRHAVERREGFEVETLLELLADRSQPADDELPDTGVGIGNERLLAPIFIASENYGTRCSTVLLIDRDGRVTLVERSFQNNQTLPATVTYQYEKLPSIPPASF
jgi:uncharacterized protein with NRDE domain